MPVVTADDTIVRSSVSPTVAVPGVPDGVPEITPVEDFGFLMTKEGGLLYFHRNAMLSGS